MIQESGFLAGRGPWMEQPRGWFLVSFESKTFSPFLKPCPFYYALRRPNVRFTSRWKKASGTHLSQLRQAAAAHPSVPRGAKGRQTGLFRQCGWSPYKALGVGKGEAQVKVWRNSELKGGTYMSASLRWGPQGPRGHAPPPSPALLLRVPRWSLPGAWAERGGRSLLHALSGEIIGASRQPLLAGARGGARWTAGSAEFKCGSRRPGGGRGGRFHLTEKLEES